MVFLDGQNGGVVKGYHSQIAEPMSNSTLGG